MQNQAHTLRQIVQARAPQCDFTKKHFTRNDAHAQLHLNLCNPQVPRVRWQHICESVLLLAQLLIAGLLQQPHQLLPQPSVHVGGMRRVFQLIRLPLLSCSALLVSGFCFRREFLAQLSCARGASLQTPQLHSSFMKHAPYGHITFFTGVRSGLTGCGGGPTSPLPSRGVMTDVKPWRSSLRAQYGQRISFPVTCRRVTMRKGEAHQNETKLSVTPTAACN